MNCTFRHYHPSKFETEYCLWLEARRQAGEIRSIRLYPNLKISRQKTWKADFEVERIDGTIEIHEAKGLNPSDDNFRLRLALFFEKNPDAIVYVNKVRVYPSESGRRILNLPRKTRRRAIPKRLDRRIIA